VYDAVMRAQRERDASHGGGVGLRDRLLGWIPGRRTAEVVAPQPISEEPYLEEPSVDLEQLSSRVDASVALQEKLSSIEVTVDALDDRISAEIVEREAKMLEAIGRGIRGLETELLIRITSAARETQRSIRVTAAIAVGVIVLLAGITIGLLREL
jgi:hypothetical protein